MRPIASALAIAAVVAWPQITPVTGARISLIEREQGAVRVTIENHRDSMLVEVEVKSLFTERVAIGPHERHAISIPLRGVMPTAPDVIFAAFADGHAEGLRPVVERRLKDRQSHLDDLGYWVRAFMNMPRISWIDVRRFLVDRIAERSVGDRPNFPHVSDRVRDLLRRYPEGPDLWPALDELRKQVEREFTAATTSGEKPPAIVDAVTSAAVVSSERVPSAAYFAVIENLRDIPIEALAWDEIDPASGRTRGGRRTDYCCFSDPDNRTSGHGPIQPHERREEMANRYPNDGERALNVSLVMFDDLSFQGSPAIRDDILRRREETADEYAFAIETLKAAVTRQADDVEPFLLSAKVDLTRRLQLAGKQPRPIGPIDEALRQFRESPSTFPDRMAGYRPYLERVVQRLRRHLSSAVK